MTKDVVTLTPDMSVAEAEDILLRYRIRGAPVVDRGQQMVGMISFVDFAGRVGKKVRDL
jgi:CBS domain-containing protein